ncbi:MAG: type II toxin-antitoxin system prevent-host-death family antitoxin [Chloroflexi bacterium]|nr:type II toxin-antitoxin system prevent-host-death family antitoxin [Chloroflexota bacterium]
MVRVSYTEARAHLAELIDRATDDRETIVISRRGKRPVAMLVLDELESLRETLHLMRSPRNLVRLMESVEQADRGEGEVLTLKDLRARVGLDESWTAKGRETTRKPRKRERPSG